MKKSFRDKVRDALARKHIAVVTQGGRPCHSGAVNVITTKIAFRHFWGKNFLKEIQWYDWLNNAKGNTKYYGGNLYIGDWKFTSEGRTKQVVIERLAKSFCDTVPLFTASGKEIERQEPANG